MSQTASAALIPTETLAKIIDGSHLRILDASWHMPAEKRDAWVEYEKEHIPGAVFFDIDAASDRGSPYPHMLPSPEDFASYVSSLGIGNDNDVVLYDTNGIFSAARVWWMFRVFGHEKVSILDGGLLKWKAEGRTLKTDIPSFKPGIFCSTFRPALLRDKRAIAENIISRKELLLDARSQARFEGREPEPRPGLKSGHIEGSSNLFFKDCLEAPHNTLSSPAKLQKLFSERSIDPNHPIVSTCGSGVTACILALALYTLGNKKVPVYDGAWAEWGSIS